MEGAALVVPRLPFIASKLRVGGRRAALALIGAVCAGATLAPAALARDLYATTDSGNLIRFDLATNQPTGTPVPIDLTAFPFTLAVTPDGRTVAVANDGLNDVSLIDVATGQAAAPIPIGGSPFGVGITPDGSRAYVANNGDGSVSVIDLGTKQAVGPPIEVGGEPSAIAVAPDGRHVYVANSLSETVSVIDTATEQTVGPEIKVGDAPNGLAITPDGRSVFVINVFGYANVIDTETNQASAPIPLGSEPGFVAIGPDGTRAYVSNYADGTVSVIDTATRQVVGTPIPVGEHVGALTVTPDGRRLLVVRYGTPDQIVSIDTATDQLSGSPMSTGEGLYGIAVAPDQPPTASFMPPRVVRPEVPATFDASASSDPDGAIATSAWAFGDGATASSSGPEQSHAYEKPGIYEVTLTLTDDESCSTAMVFTGQTAFCNGSAVATQARAVEVAYPGVRVKCPRKARGGCRFRLKAVARIGRKKHRRLRVQSAVARARVKAGRRAIVTLKPKRAFAEKLATARKLLVQEVITVGAKRRTRLRRLKVVR
jgi:YVTN family beta-propeller protein